MRFDRLDYMKKTTGLANCVKYVEKILKSKGITLENFSDHEVNRLKNIYIDKYLMTLDYNEDGTLNEKPENDFSDVFNKAIQEAQENL